MLDNILKALRIAHKKGVVHSDISPDNIMFDEISGKYKLNDFGLAKLLNSTLMRRGSMKSFTGGKPGFLPLIDWQTGQRTTHSDLYGLAATVVYLLTGKLPLWNNRGGSLNPPLIDEYFDLSSTSLDLDSPIIDTFTNEGEERSIFSVSRRNRRKLWEVGKATWRFRVNITRREMVDLLGEILRGDIVSVEDALKFIRNLTLNRLDPLNLSDPLGIFVKEDEKIKDTQT